MLGKIIEENKKQEIIFKQISIYVSYFQETKNENSYQISSCFLFSKKKKTKNEKQETRNRKQKCYQTDP